MGTEAGVGWSKNRNPRVAAFEAAEKALNNAGITKPDFVFLFSTVGYDQRLLLDSVRKATLSAPLCGCSGEGVIAPEFIDESNFSVVVTVLKSDEIIFNNGLCRGISTDPEGSGKNLSVSMKKVINDDSHGIFLFPDFKLNFDKLFVSFEKNLNLNRFLPIWGAVASDNFKFKESFQYCNDEISNDGMSWALISGNTEIKNIIGHGCSPVGIEHTVTKSNGNIIEEIDGRPANSVITDYLDFDLHNTWDSSQVRAEIYAGFLVNSAASSEKRIMVRAIVGGKDISSGAIITPSEFQAGTKILLMRRDPEQIINSFHEMGEQLLGMFDHTKPKIIFHFECAGRGKIILRDRVRLKSIIDLQNKAGSDIPWVGFYGLGEVAPFNEKNYFHNSTTVIAAIM